MLSKDINSQKNWILIHILYVLHFTERWQNSFGSLKMVDIMKNCTLSRPNYVQ